MMPEGDILKQPCVQPILMLLLGQHNKVVFQYLSAGLSLTFYSLCFC